MADVICQKLIHLVPAHPTNIVEILNFIVVGKETDV